MGSVDIALSSWLKLKANFRRKAPFCLKGMNTVKIRANRRKEAIFSNLVLEFLFWFRKEAFLFVLRLSMVIVGDVDNSTSAYYYSYRV